MASLESFVDIDEFQTAWHELDETEASRAEILLSQASNYLRQIGKNNGVDIDETIAADTSGVYKDNVKMVVEFSVERVMAVPTDVAPDATQWSQAASPYSESMSFAGGNSGNLYFKTRELELLGLKSVSGKKQISVLRGVR